jgi:hypothetical protein
MRSSSSYGKRGGSSESWDLRSESVSDAKSIENKERWGEELVELTPLPSTPWCFTTHSAIENQQHIVYHHTSRRVPPPLSTQQPSSFSEQVSNHGLLMLVLSTEWSSTHSNPSLPPHITKSLDNDDGMPLLHFVLLPVHSHSFVHLSSSLFVRLCPFPFSSLLTLDS